jgi:hypothetical protein
MEQHLRWQASGRVPANRIIDWEDLIAFALYMDFRGYRGSAGDQLKIKLFIMLGTEL